MLKAPASSNWLKQLAQVAALTSPSPHSNLCKLTLHRHFSPRIKRALCTQTTLQQKAITHSVHQTKIAATNPSTQTRHQDVVNMAEAIKQACSDGKVVSAGLAVSLLRIGRRCIASLRWKVMVIVVKVVP